MKIPIQRIRARLQLSLIHIGLNEDDAVIVANDYIGGELQGKTSHGLMAFPSLLKGYKKPKLQPKTLTKTHALLVIEAYGELGAIIARHATDTLLTMAKKEGVAVAFIKNMTTWLRPGAVAEYIANHNKIAVVMNNGGRPMVAPPGGYEAVIGTNPIGIGIPTGDIPIVIDMATSKRAWGEVKKVKHFGHSLPPETYFDSSGNFTLNADDARSVIAMGDYKGFALGLLIEILTGSLLGREMGKQLGTTDYRTLTRGGVIMVIDPSVVGANATFMEQNSHIVNTIKQSAKIKGVQHIVLPGERAQQKQKENLEKGYIEIEESLWKTLMV